MKIRAKCHHSSQSTSKLYHLAYSEDVIHQLYSHLITERCAVKSCANESSFLSITTYGEPNWMMLICCSTYRTIL